jgi:glutamine cyclotransferase
LRSTKLYMKRIFTIISLAAFFAACNPNDEKGGTGGGTIIDSPATATSTGIAVPKALSYTVISQYPHDTSSFTEGLEFYNGKLYESGGDYESSRLQITDAKTGKIEKQHKMGTAEIFGEGITVLNGKLYQLTYTTHTVYVYDIKDITKPIKTLSWPGEGWGLTNDGTNLILDAGNNNLYFVDPETFAVRKTVPVNDNAGPVQQINELEYVDGFIYANVWMTDRIIKIDPQTGNVVADMTMQNLLKPGDSIPNRTDVLNGIAYNKDTKTFFITGKRYPKIFEIRLNQ